MIIMDFPPLGAVTDAVVVHELFSRYLLVARAGATNIPDLNAKVEEFPPVKKKLLGVVLNEAIVDRKMSYYKHSHYQY
jgi:Mrp family chromosome partitioning ATPase